MGIRSLVSKPFAKYVVKQQEKWSMNPVETQEKVRKQLLKSAQHTMIGKDCGFADIKTYEDFKKQVPIRQYEGLKPYIELMLQGKSDILWKGTPQYFAKTSGTTSGSKYIPLTKESVPNHLNAARNTLLSYVADSKKSKFVDKKMMFLSGSPILEKQGEITTGRLSGIVTHHIPKYLHGNRMPSYNANCIDDWEMKIDKIVDETMKEDMSLISGIPPWVQMYFDRIIEKTGKRIIDVFPNFSLFVYGGVNFKPYKQKIFDSIGKEIDSLQTYPASEGFIAYQDLLSEEGMFMLLNMGMFFEFIPADKYFDDNPPRLSIGEVEVGKNYALIINSNAGLWGYSIGDTVKFVSTYPHRMVVSGRIKHFISAFGEHVIGEEVEKAIAHALKKSPETSVVEFTVAPMVSPKEGLPYHEWLISFENEPNDMEAFTNDIDQKLRELNSYYDDLITGAICKRLVISSLEKDAFQKYMKSIGKLGGQNKVPRLANDRKIADKIIEWKKA